MLLFLKPELLERPQQIVRINSSADTPANPRTGTPGRFSYADAVARAAPAVVNIYTLKHGSNGEKEAPGPGKSKDGRMQERSLGSGVIFSPQGYVLTSHHVITDASKILVLLNDGRSALAKLVGSDPDTDLAVLKINMKMLPAITVSNSEKVRVGDVVLAIGNPFGVGQTVTQGIVSATGRSGFGLSTYENFIQTDAAINPGNSGGALINARGELIGINSVIFSRSGGSQGIGFAIPVKTASWVLKRIIERGQVERGWLGIRVRPLNMRSARQAGLNHTLGALVSRVTGNSPASHAGIQPGDVIVHVNKDAIEDSDELMNLIATTAPRTKLMIHGIRDGQPFSAEVTVGIRPMRSAP